MLLPDEFTNDLPSEITEKDVRIIARKYKTHPGIVVGRLQYLNLVNYSFGSSYRVKIHLDDYIPGRKSDRS